MVDIGFSLQASYDLPWEQVIGCLHDAGFGAVSPVWSPELPLELLSTSVQAHNMVIQSLHAPHGGLAYLWDSKVPGSAQAEQRIIGYIDACARFQIPLAVMHGWQGLDYTFPAEPLDFSVFDRIVAHAEKKQVAIAFENLEGPEFLAALLDRYSGTHVGFCWDSGHERCYTPGWDFLHHYGDRLIMTHLNDNFGVTDPSGRLQGTDDLHLLLFDGNTDWNHTVQRLKQARPQEILNFEFKIRPKGDRCKMDLYSKLPLEQYIARACTGAKRIAYHYFED